MTDYLIFESKKSDKDRVVAVEFSDDRRDAFEKEYDRAGLLSGLSAEDFRHHEHWGFNYLPIEVSGSIKEAQPAKEAIKKGLEAICQSPSLTFNQTGLIADTAIVSQIFNYEIVKGDVYIVRFSGIDLYKKEDITRSVAYFLAPSDGEVSLKRKKLFIGGEQIELPESDLKFLVNCGSYKGTLKAFKAGEMQLFRKSLRPYPSTGRFGSPYSNGPWIVL